MESHLWKFSLRLLRSALLILCILSFFDYIENSKFIQNCAEYATYKYLLLTKISLFFTLLSSTSGLLKRITGINSKPHVFLLAISSCLQTIVFILFWGLMFFDKKLVVDHKAIQQKTEASLWNRLCSHAFPFILSYLNMHEMSLNYSGNHIAFFIIFTILYFLATSFYSWYFNRDVYPLLSKINIIQKLFVFFGVAVVSIIIYLINIKLFSKNKKEQKLE